MRLVWCVLGVAFVPAAVAVADAHMATPQTRLALPPIAVAPQTPPPTLMPPPKRARTPMPTLHDEACAACVSPASVAPLDRTDPWNGKPTPMPAAPMADAHDPWNGEPMAVARMSLALDTTDPWN
ncbi:MAG TPA: hypothetical protein VIF62_32720 [Labilithrix sp.]|jgi:hypothetical protein